LLCHLHVAPITKIHCWTKLVTSAIATTLLLQCTCICAWAIAICFDSTAGSRQQLLLDVLLGFQHLVNGLELSGPARKCRRAGVAVVNRSPNVLIWSYNDPVQRFIVARTLSDHELICVANTYPKGEVRVRFSGMHFNVVTITTCFQSMQLITTFSVNSNAVIRNSPELLIAIFRKSSYLHIYICHDYLLSYVSVKYSFKTTWIDYNSLYIYWYLEMHSHYVAGIASF
jgi:hypothetical protein